MRIVNSQIVCHTRNRTVKLATTQILSGNFFPCGGLDEWRSSKEDSSLVFHDYCLITHGWNVGTSSCAWAHDYRYLRNTLRAHPRLIEENASKVFLIWEDIGLVRQVGTTRINKIKTWQLVFLGDGLRT